MTYNLKRALGVGFCLYFATFIVGIICGALLNKDTTSMTSFPASYWYISMAAAVVLTYLFTTWYFKNPAIIPSAKSGFWFGLTTVALSFVLDYLSFTAGNMSSEQQFDIGAYYSDYRFWIVIVLVLATAKFVGHLKRPKATV